MPKMMAAVFAEPGRIVLESRPVPDVDPLDALVTAFLDDAIESPVRYIGDRPKGAELVARVRSSGAEGVLFCAPSSGDGKVSKAERKQFAQDLLSEDISALAKAQEKLYAADSWSLLVIFQAMDAAGIPWTAFKYAENNGQFQVIREQAGTFADSIKLWSGV